MERKDLLTELSPTQQIVTILLGNEVRSGYRQEVEYEVNTNLEDLYITFGKHFPDLIPESNAPLPDEELYAANRREEPIIFSGGLPIDAGILVKRTAFSPAVPYRYHSEVSVVFNFMEQKDRDWSLYIGRHSARQGVFRNIHAPLNERFGIDKQGWKIMEHPSNEAEFNKLLVKYIGERVVKHFPE
jgi:hypothetical protein